MSEWRHIPSVAEAWAGAEMTTVSATGLKTYEGEPAVQLKVDGRMVAFLTLADVDTLVRALLGGANEAIALAVTK